MKKILFSIVSAVLLFLGCSSQAIDLSNVRYTQQDVANFNEVMKLLSADKELPMDQTVMKVAKHFLGTPYVSSTLELSPEMLTINTRETDCILFVEMCLALSLTSKEAEPSFERYCEILQSLRYRNGIVDGYPSRLHYTSEWIIQGSAAGHFREISKEIGGKPLDQKFFFMSTHQNSYRQLKEDPSQTARIAEAEKNLETYKYWYIPKADLPSCIKNIKDGDIVCFNCATPGLDIAHVAYAYWENGKLTFIHASFTEKKVVINKTPLVEYTKGVKAHNGLRVLRLNDK